MQCKGITKKGVRCKNIASIPPENPQVCHLHKEQLTSPGKKIIAKKILIKKTKLAKKTIPKVKVLTEYEKEIDSLLNRTGELFSVLIDLYRAGLKRYQGSRLPAIEFLKSKFTRELYEINYPIMVNGLQLLEDYLQKYSQTSNPQEQVKITFYRAQIPQIQRVIQILFNLFNETGGTGNIEKMFQEYELQELQAMEQMIQMPTAPTTLPITTKKKISSKTAVKLPIN